MQQQINRVATGLEQWRQKEERFSKIFSPSILKDKAFLEQKLSFLVHLQRRYGKSRDPEEQLALQILARQRAQLKKELYPNFFQRLFNSIRQVLAVEKEQRMDKQRSAANLPVLSDKISKAGFGDLRGELSKNLAAGQQHFQLPVSRYVSQNEKMDYKLNFSKDENGHFQLTGYDAALKKEGSRTPGVPQHFSSDINALQAQNLLQGRALFKQNAEPGSPVSQGKWIQLDFNDKDAAGQYRVKEFHQGFGYDIQKEISRLNLQKEGFGQDIQKLTESLKNGDRTPVTLQKDGKETKIFLEANPQFKNLTVYDQNHQKTSIARGDTVHAQTKTIQAQHKQPVKVQKVNTNRPRR